MALWDNIRNYFYKRALADKTSNLQVDRKLINWGEAKRIGILYDSTPAGNDETIQQFASQLKKQEKKVSVLGYINDTKTAALAGAAIFNRKMINWAQVPVNEPADYFAQKEFDLLLACFTGENLPLEYICQTSHAKCRLGVYAPGKTACFDMMIKVGENKDLPYLIEQSVYFLNQIKHDSN